MDTSDKNIELKNVMELWGSKGFDKLIFDSITKETIEPNKAVYSMIVPKHLCNILNTLHGGAIASIIDIVSSVAIMTSIPELKPSVTVEMSIQYGTGAKLGEKVTIESTCYKIGKNLAYSDTSLKNSKGDTIAKGSHTKFVGLKVSKL
eukprot:gene3639-4531_t